jgi:hypothetical protein
MLVGDGLLSMVFNLCLVSSALRAFRMVSMDLVHCLRDPQLDSAPFRSSCISSSEVRIFLLLMPDFRTGGLASSLPSAHRDRKSIDH